LSTKETHIDGSFRDSFLVETKEFIILRFLRSLYFLQLGNQKPFW